MGMGMHVDGMGWMGWDGWDGRQYAMPYVDMLGFFSSLARFFPLRSSSEIHVQKWVGFVRVLFCARVTITILNEHQ
jgi:hypothetical protein